MTLVASGVNESSANWEACWYFTAAKSAEKALGVDCGPTKPPAAEVVTGRTATFVFLADPAGVKGSLDGSGGSYRAVGGIRYSGGSAIRPRRS